MRTRALLLIPTLVATVLCTGASGASAATLFTTTAHTTRVTVGATADATVVGNLDWTAPAGTLANRCTGGNLHLVVGANNDTAGVDIRAVSGNLTPCEPRTLTPTFPWTLTITGNAAVLGSNTRYAAFLHNFAFDIQDLGLFSGNLSTGITAFQPTTGTSPITLNLANAGTALNGAFGNVTFDGNIRLATPWSLTN